MKIQQMKMLDKMNYKISLMILIWYAEVHTFWNTSLYTTFVVLSMQSPFSSVMSIFKPFLDDTLETATYNWSWENTDCNR